MTGEKQRSDRLIALMLAGVLFINYPLLTIFDRSAYFLGIPVLYLFLFVFWFVFICLLAALLGRPAVDEQPSRTAPSDLTD